MKMCATRFSSSYLFPYGKSDRLNSISYSNSTSMSCSRPPKNCFPIQCANSEHNQMLNLSNDFSFRSVFRVCASIPPPKVSFKVWTAGAAIEKLWFDRSFFVSSLNFICSPFAISWKFHWLNFVLYCRYPKRFVAYVMMMNQLDFCA